MSSSDRRTVVGLDVGGTAINATVLDSTGQFLVEHLVETPSRVLEGPEVAVDALATAMDNVLKLTVTPRAEVAAVGLDTPGPASADGVISSKGSTNFSQPAWRGYDFRGALEARLGLPVIYNNDGNAAALYAHFVNFGKTANDHSSVSAIRFPSDSPPHLARSGITMSTARLSSSSRNG
jgi:glucokinase